MGAETLQRHLLHHADHRIVVAGHADVGDVGGAARQDLVVGGRHVGVAADHERSAAVGEVAERRLLAGRLGMDVDHDRVGRSAERMLREFGVERAERVAVGAHEQATDHLQHQHLAAVREAQLGAAATRRPGQHVQRTDQPRILADMANDVALVEDVVAGGDQVGAGGIEFPADLRRDAEAAGGVLAIDDRDVETQIGSQPRQRLDQQPASGAADDVAAVEDPHRPPPRHHEAVQRALGDHAIERHVGRDRSAPRRPPARRTQCRSRAGGVRGYAARRACGRSSPCRSRAGLPGDRRRGAASGPRPATAADARDAARAT